MIIGMVENDFQRQADELVAMAGKLHQQAIGLVELEAPIGRGMEFLEVGLLKSSRSSAFCNLANCVATLPISRS
jgi:hypothetical protein